MEEEIKRFKMLLFVGVMYNCNVSKSVKMDVPASIFFLLIFITYYLKLHIL